MTVTEARIREAPSMDAETTECAYYNDIAAATGEVSGEWIRICREPLYGWMHISVLSICEPYENLTAVVVADGRTKLYDAPGGDRYQWLRPGDTVKVLASIEYAGRMWRRVQYGDAKGFVPGEYLRAI